MTDIFAPVIVTRGRKFRGKAYSIGDVRPGMYGSWNSKLWDPVSKKYVWANTDFCDDDESVTPEQVQADKATYLKHIIDDTVAWCRSCKPNAAEDEVMQFARNVLRKRHPEITEEMLNSNNLSDRRDISIEVEKTLNWAIKLTTKPCLIYGRWCKGGRPLPEEKKIRIAFKALTRKGLTGKPEFRPIWTFTLSMMGLAKYADMTI